MSETAPRIDAARLALFTRDGCAYSARVWSACRDLGVDIEPLDINASAEHLHELHAATGRTTVPVLRIAPADGSQDEVQYMPESGDIVTFLYGQYGEGARPPLLTRLGPGVVTALVVGGAFALSQVVDGPWPWLIAVGVLLVTQVAPRAKRPKAG